MANTTYKLFGMRKIVAWVLGQASTLAGSVADATTTSITVASGFGTAFAGASTSQPHRIRVSTAAAVERMNVIARAGDVLTVVRGRDGSTAGTAPGTAVLAHLFPVRIPKSSAFAMNGNIQTLEFPGDGDVERVYQSNGIDGTITLTKFATDLLELLSNAPAVSTGLYSDESTRRYPEQGTYPFCELWVDQKAQNDASGNNATIRTTVFSAKLQDPFIIGSPGNNTPQTTQFTWTAQAVQADLFGDALPGATEEVHYAYSELT